VRLSWSAHKSARGGGGGRAEGSPLVCQKNVQHNRSWIVGIDSTDTPRARGGLGPDSLLPERAARARSPERSRTVAGAEPNPLLLKQQ
jgi:hypothetical protein